MNSIINKIEKKVTKKGIDLINSYADKLDNREKLDVSSITFPHNLENQAQATYMVIYVLDNENNKKTFSNTVFNANIDTYSYEIPAITFLKEYGKQELERLKTWAKEQAKKAGDAIVESLEGWADKWTKEHVGEKNVERVKQVAKDVESIGDWVNTWLVPQKVKNPSNELKKQLDPVKNPGQGYKLVKAIALQMPTSQLTYTYENGWESSDTSTLATIKSLIEGFSSLLGGKDGSKAKAKLSGVATRIEEAVGNALTGGGYSAERREKNRIVPNPVLAFNYTVPEPRTFSYSFSLYPRNKSELYTLFNLIQQLKFYALPEIPSKGKSDQPLYFNYPAKFSIKFYTNGYENQWLPKMAHLGLTSIEETLTGENGDMAYFENYFDTASGNPPKIVNLTLKFKELAIMSRDYVNAGY